MDSNKKKNFFLRHLFLCLKKKNIFTAHIPHHHRIVFVFLFRPFWLYIIFNKIRFSCIVIFVCWTLNSMVYISLYRRTCVFSLVTFVSALNKKFRLSWKYRRRLGNIQKTTKRNKQ
jgi:hypothetical protein